MNVALQKCDAGWEPIGEDRHTPRTDATFTEIYELIFYNRTMVRSEWEVLQQLIQKKYTEKIGAVGMHTDCEVRGTRGEETVAARIRPACNQP